MDNLQQDATQTACLNQHSTRGIALPAALLLATVSALLAVSALRSAATEVQLQGTLTAAHKAFQLAELGVESALTYATANPGTLPQEATLTLARHTDNGQGHVDTRIIPGNTDTHCPTLAPLPSLRRHYEIHATAYSDRAAVTTHVQGFFICSEICTAIYCEAREEYPVRSYWSAIAGGLHY